MNWFIICFFVISIILFVVIRYYFLKNKADKEDFETFENEKKLTSTEKLLKEHHVALRFIDSKTARTLVIKKGEYLQGMNQSNLSARNCISIDQLYNKYLDAFYDITEKEKSTVIDFTLNLLIEIKNKSFAYHKYLVYWLNKIFIAKAKGWLESGMPHTLETTIIMN